MSFLQAQSRSLRAWDIVCLKHCRVKQQQPCAEAALRNLKRFLSHCEDIYTCYRLAYEHKFYDVVNSLLKDPQTGCCLNDLLAS